MLFHAVKSCSMVYTLRAILAVITILVSLLNGVSLSAVRTDYSWQTALDYQLNLLRNKYNNQPQEVYVIHLGITDRFDKAIDIAESLSDSLGHPVIALPSYQGTPQADILRAVAQYFSSSSYKVHFEQSWQQIINSGHKIIGLVIHSGAGLRANSERDNLISFIKSHPGAVTGNIAFAMTDLHGRTKSDFAKVGINAVQIGADDFVSWVTRPAYRYIPYGEYIKPLGSLLGWRGKLEGVVRTIPPFGTFLSKHPLNRRVDELRENLNTAESASGATSADYGGIDLSSLELRFFSEYDYGQLNFIGSSFKLVPASAGESLDPGRMSELAWDSLAVWLTLPNSAFWVNLNPAEPNRIVDAELAKTDVGRILLEADFQMKKDLARLTNPKDSPLGRSFWDKIYSLGSNETADSGWTATPISFRVWIVPGPIVVWATEECIHIHEAHLDVRLESDYLRQSGTRSPTLAGPVTSQANEHNKAERILVEMILPELENEVNTGSQYAELRTIFHSRIIAEWYKTIHKSEHRVFGEIIGQGKADPWKSSVPWNPRSIFEKYRRSIAEGEYSLQEKNSVTRGTHRLTTIKSYFFGGVDFISIKKKEITYEKLLMLNPEFVNQTLDALLTPTGYWNDKEAWIGGLFVAGISSAGGGLSGSGPPELNDSSLDGDGDGGESGDGGGEGSYQPPDGSALLILVVVIIVAVVIIFLVQARNRQKSPNRTGLNRSRERRSRERHPW